MLGRVRVVSTLLAIVGLSCMITITEGWASESSVAKRRNPWSRSSQWRCLLYVPVPLRASVRADDHAADNFDGHRNNSKDERGTSLPSSGGDSTTSSQRSSGTVKWFNILKGYGFILPDDEGQPDVFVHQSDIVADGYRSLADGDSVEYQLQLDETKNRWKAVQVTGPGVRVQGGDFRPDF